MTEPANRLWNPWANDRGTLELYRRRCRREAEEMTCAAQAADILMAKVGTRETLLDAGCGGGYYYWSLLDRGVRVAYHGLDYTAEMIELARAEMCPRTGLGQDQFALGWIENLNERFDNVICFNVLTNSPHYALPLGRLLECAGKRILLRESMGPALITRYTPDPFLDPDKRHIRVYHNTYPIEEVANFMRDHGFAVTRVTDKRTQDGTEMVVGIPHTWRILIGERISALG